MINSLLDFVMSVVRDPGTAAQYAADPAQAIAAAGLTDVTSADVDQLIPVVAESLAPAAEANVWSSGAATAAFDAFGIDDALPAPVDDLHDLSIPTVVDPGTAGAGYSELPTSVDDLLDAPQVAVLDDVPIADPAFDAEIPDWAGPDTLPEVPGPDGFDLFD